MESMEDDENRSPDAEDLEMAAKYRARSHQRDPIVKIEGAATSDAPFYSMEPAPRSELSGDANASNLPPGQAQGNQGYVDSDLLRDLFGETDEDDEQWKD